MSKPEQVLVIEPQNELRFRGETANSILTLESCSPIINSDRTSKESISRF